MRHQRLSSPDCMPHYLCLRLSSPDGMPHQVHSATHPGMRGPLNLLMGENWLVWHFWNPSQLSYQMAVIELFTNVTFAVRLSPPISAQSRLQSRPNLACHLGLISPAISPRRTIPSHS